MKYTLSLLICVCLAISCQSASPDAQNLGNNHLVSTNQDAEVNEKTELSESTATSPPLPEPTETTQPTPESTPTLDPMNTSFGARAHYLYNLKGGGPIISMSWHPDSNLYAMSGIESVLVWDIQSLSHAYILEGHQDVIIEVDWSPDGNTLASLSLDGTILLWEAPEYEESLTLETVDALCLSWIPKNKYLMVGTRTGEIQVWNPSEGEIILTWQSVEASPILNLQVSPDSAMVAVGYETGMASIWDIDQQSMIQTITDVEKNPVTDLQWSWDGKYLATAHKNGFVYLWDLSSWTIVHTFEGEVEGDTIVAWSPDSLILATSGNKNRITLHEVKSGELITGVGIEGQVWSMAWSPNEKFLSIGSAGLINNPGWLSDPGSWELNPDAGLTYLWIRQ